MSAVKAEGLPIDVVSESMLMMCASYHLYLLLNAGKGKFDGKKGCSAPKKNALSFMSLICPSTRKSISDMEGHGNRV
jgi:hypothetical protein